MATQVVMPKLSPTMEEGQLARWLKKEGDAVQVGEPIAEIDTDKATMEAQALASGVLRKILASAGDTVPLGKVIAIIGAPNEDISQLLSEQKPDSGPEQQRRIEESVEAGADVAQEEVARVVPDRSRTRTTIKGDALSQDADERGGPDGEHPGPAQAQPTPELSQQKDSAVDGNGQRSSGRLLISPIAARMAAEAGIDLKALSGSGPGGRIIKRDIEAALQPETMGVSGTDQQLNATPQPSEAPESVSEPHEVEVAPAYRDQPVSEIRKVIARRLISSLGPVPHFFLTIEVNMDRAAELRRSLNDLDEATKISFNDMVVKAAGKALIEHPKVNASFQENALRFYERADIGVAVAIEEGLITPVIRSANTKSLSQISREIRELAERARKRKLRPEEYTGATFSVSNLGMLAIEEFTAVINPPEAAILAVGSVQPRPVVRDRELAIAETMRVTMSCDHRIIDGATGARFLQTFRKMLETPLQLVI